MTSFGLNPSKRIRFSLCAAFLLTLPLSLLAQIATLQRLTPAQAKAMCCKLPPGVEMWNSPREDRQTVQLKAPDSEDLTIVPVRLNNNSPEPRGEVGPGPQCGAYFLRPTGQSQYVGLGWPKIMVGKQMVRDNLCDGVLALGSTHDPGPRPRLIFLLSEETGIGPTGNDPFPVPYILHWNPQSSWYELDAKPTVWLQYRDCNGTKQDCGGTISAVRRLLAQYDATPGTATTP